MEGLEQEYGGPRTGRSWDLWREVLAAAGQGLDAPAAEVAASLKPMGAVALARALPGILDLVGVEPQASPLSERVDELVRAVQPDLLTAALRRLDVAARRAFAEDASEHLGPASLARLVVAAAPTYGAALSQPFRELVEKLAREASQADAVLRQRADGAFRSLVRQVFARWSTTQVDAGSTSFEAMFQRRPVEGRRSTRLVAEPLRVLQLALEADVLGPIVWSALGEQIETEAGMRALLDLLKRAPAGRARGTIAEQAATPGRLGGLLAEDPVDWEAVDTLLPHMGLTAARPLLDALAESSNRAVRRRLMDRLAQLGPEVRPLVLERLGDRRWYVVRNLVGVLREAGCSLEKVPVEALLQHGDARVRRELLQLRLEHPEERDTAVAEALLDPDRQVLRTALQAARTQLAPTGTAMLAQRVSDPAFPPEFRVLALYLLGRSGEPAALETLLRFVDGGRTLFGRAKLAPTSPEMLAALSGLVRSWPAEKRVRELLAVAAGSRDAQIHNALHAGGGGEERS